jgi:hypothetical protein
VVRRFFTVASPIPIVRRLAFNIVSLLGLLFWVAVLILLVSLLQVRASGGIIIVGYEVSPNPVLRFVVMPALLIALLIVAVMPFIWVGSHVRRTSRRRRVAAGACPRCGYSLTGNTSGVCPECGTPIQKTPAEKSPRPA